MSLSDTKKIFLRSGFIIILLLVVSAYAFIETRKMISGPSIEVSYPPNGETITESPVSISGIAQNVSALSLNDRPVYVDGEGRFSEAVALLPGYNILSFKGEDRFGKKTETTLEVVFEDNLKAD